MESLAEVLQRLGPTIGMPSSGDSPRISDTPLDKLQRLPPTAKVQDAHIAFITRLNAEQEPPSPAAVEMRAHGEHLIELCLYRDSVQAGRPDGCWCLGLGGKGRGYVPAWGSTQEEAVYHEYCGCPEGQAAQRRDAGIRERYQLHRRQMRMARLWGTAEVPERLLPFSFRSYPVTPENEADVAAIRQWAMNASSPQGLYVYGLLGRGKTALAVAAMRQRVHEHLQEALFMPTTDLLDRIKATYGDHAGPSEADLMNSVKQVELLLLDDIGAERPSGWVSERFFSLVDRRYNDNRPCIYTSNLDPEALALHIGERTAWRIMETCQVVHLHGPNLRA